MGYVLFDLDGTLTDPGPGITNAVAYALNKFGITVANKEELYPYIGPPLTWSFQQYHGLSADQAEEALIQYRVYFAERGLFENEVYPGIPTLLSILQAAGHTLIVATSKPEEFTNRILEHFGLDKYFSLVAGNTLDEARPTKEAVLAYALERYPAITSRNAIMVGDRKFDIVGAHSLGLPAVGVLFGYGSREELVEAGADRLVEDVPALCAVLQDMLRERE